MVSGSCAGESELCGLVWTSGEGFTEVSSVLKVVCALWGGSVEGAGVVVGLSLVLVGKSSVSAELGGTDVSMISKGTISLDSTFTVSADSFSV